MTVNEIRNRFLKFFELMGHKIITSDTLVPKNDPTVLFTTAGMQQFKQQFLGHLEGYTRATTSQKCLRTDDLDEVGKTDFHHTFFEMLGNFSFGDYFKKEAILWAWEFLTKELGIPTEKLWVSVNKEDKDAEAIWKNDIGIADIKIFRLGDKSNFWPSNARLNGPNGPCGPCSEIFFDYDWETRGLKDAPKDPDDENGRFCEIWNLVFTQFNRKEGGALDPLPNKNIDTGMGLERLTAVMQGVKNNFNSSLFQPIITDIESIISELPLREKRIIADHMRAVTFGIADGVIPSNEGRGYIMKKLINTMSEIVISQTNQEQVVLYRLVSSVANVMKTQYPEIDKKVKEIADIVMRTEEAYLKMRREKIPQFEEALLNAQKDKSSAQKLGEIIFDFRDTHGLPVPLMETMLLKANFNTKLIAEAIEVYKKLMTEQQERSRAGSKMTGDVFTGTKLELNVPKTDFVGHKHLKSTDTILRIFKNNVPIPEANQGEQVIIVLDRTAFYAESGGQIGDIGYICNGQNRFRVEDTQKMSEVFLHIGVVETGKFKVGELISSEIDVERRMSIMRNHTATHLLQAALREVLGSHVQQQGSFVSNERLRLDFTHPKALTDQELKKIELRVNQLILACEGVIKEFLPIEEAKSTGALAFFAEKYNEVVRVISVTDYSKEFCGGTHIDSTGEIGVFKIIGETAVAQGIRRIEAKTGINALKYIEEQETILNQLLSLFKCNGAELAEKASAQFNYIKEMEKQIENLKLQNVLPLIDDIIKKAETIGDNKIIVHNFADLDINTLRKISDLLKQKLSFFAAILGATLADNGAILIAISDNLVKKGINAQEFIQTAATMINGKGGGRAQIAQAGTKEIDKIESTVKAISQSIKEKIAK